MNETTPHNAPATDEGFALPEALKKQLSAFEKRLCRTESLVALFGSITALLLAFGLVFLSDRFWDTSAWVRVVIALGSTAALLGFFWLWFRAWVLKRRDSRELARLVQRKYRRLGDRLLGAVELANPQANVDDLMSPALRRAAIRQVGEEAASYNFTDAVDTRTSSRLRLSLLGLGVLVVIAASLYPEAGMNALQRWLKPLSSVPRYTFVKLTGFPKSIVVPHGEDFRVEGSVAPESKWIPDAASSAFDGQPPVAGDIIAGDITRVGFDIPGQTDAGTLRIQVGDYKDTVEVNPLLRPELQTLTAMIALPDYLQHPATTNILQTPNLQVVEGSRLQFRGQISRDLKSADASGTTSPVPTRASGPEIETDTFQVDSSRALTLNWTDTHGLSNDLPYTIKINTVKDQPPFVDCRSASRAIAILEDEVVTFDLSADDDFGIQKMWMEWTAVDGQSKALEDAAGSAVIAEGDFTQRRLAKEYTFSPLTAHVPEESVVTLQACASDYFPERAPSVSPPIRIYILSRTQHAELVQKQMEAVHAQIEDIARLEEELLDKNKAEDQKSPEDLAKSETRQALRENEASEWRQAERLDRLAEETADLMKEALRNSDIPESTLAEWSELQQTMKEVSEQAMKQAAQSLQKAGDQPSERKEELEKAIAKQEEAVKKLQEAGKEMNESLENMMAESFVNRLKQESEREKAIAEAMGQILPKTIGLARENMPAEVAAELDQAAAMQMETKTQVGYIQDDLAGFYTRTRAEPYNNVYKEMRSTNVVEELERLANLISGNIAIQSIADTKKWSDQLLKWSEALKPPQQDSGGGGEGGGSEELNAEDMETLIALMRTRMLEEGLRKQTRLLEESRETNRSYRSDARKLGSKQSELAASTRPLERRVKNDKLRLLIEKIGGEMMNTSMLLQRPQTDRETIAIETEIIELLSNSIKEASGGQSSGAGQMMAQMMGQGEGEQPGKGAGSGGGGEGEGDSAGGEGGLDGDPGDEGRRVERSSGMSRETPQEFRDVLDAYFQALENSP